MRVAINLVEFNPGAMGGIETYVFNLLQWLLRNDSGSHYTVVCSESNAGYFRTINQRMSLTIIDNRRRSMDRIVRSLLRKTIGVDLLARRIDALGVDMVHNPLTNIRPMTLATPSVVTFHDIQHEYHPELFSRRELLRRKEKYGKAAYGAGRIIAISGHVKQTLIDTFSLRPDKIDVVYQGCGPEYRPIMDGSRLAAIREKYDLHRPFLYYPAAMWPHKNHGNLLRALKMLRVLESFDGRLVLTGHHASAEVTAEIRRLGLEDMVKILGRLPYEELPYIYNLARIMVFPSFFEGFGIPLVEAMACGCPVVCSERTSIPEVTGDAGVLFDPASPADIAEKILSVWNDGHSLAAMRQRGLARARDFTWEQTAWKTRDVYLKAEGKERVTDSREPADGHFRCFNEAG
jgi:glycosyltransferase involved in cell wall biosynthesis